MAKCNTSINKVLVWKRRAYFFFIFLFFFFIFFLIIWDSK